MNNQKLYVITRSDLSKSQQAVQAGHALAEFCLESGAITLSKWGNGILVYLRVKNLDELQKLQKEVGKTFPFYEPDIDNELTAFAHLGGHPAFECLPLL